MPKDIEFIINRLKSYGFSAYIVGGSLRDMLLGIKPCDYDIATSAKPEEVENIFKGYILSDIGRKYGTIVVRINKYDVEITTFRLEGSYEENRKPCNVVFTDRIEDDLLRRDFTVNAMASDGEVFIDLFSGRQDIEKKIIRTVNNPDMRIKEDALRILRAVRISSKLGFEIDIELKKAIKRNRNLLYNLSKERIKQEIEKILLSDRPSVAFRTMQELDILEIVLQDLYKCIDFNQENPHHSMDLFNHTLCVVDNVDKNIALRYAALFHDIGKIYTKSYDENHIAHYYNHEIKSAEIAQRVLTEFNVSNEIKKRVNILITEHMKVSENATDKALRRKIRKVSEDNIFLLYSLLISDRICTIENREIEFLEKQTQRIKELLNEETAKEKFLKINGTDIMKLGYKEGKIIGEILRYLEDIVIDKPSLNDREKLIEIVKNKF